MTTMPRMIPFVDALAAQSPVSDEVIAGLSRSPKELPAKFFYDDRGAMLFEKITALPEYYLTRTEIAILDENIDEIARMLGPRCALLEFGSGTSRKTTLLLEELDDPLYVPIDISKVSVLESSAVLAARYPGLRIIAVCADYTKRFNLPPLEHCERRVIFFPGSTVGNLTPAEAATFFDSLASMLQPRDGLLIGADLRKQRHLLHAAYNDSEGVTAEFNLNILERINRDLGANFRRELFQHVAFYNETEGRIEMHLLSTASQSVDVAGRRFTLAPGEMIHTENSYKYDPQMFCTMIESAGFTTARIWTDPQNWFGVFYFERA